MNPKNTWEGKLEVASFSAIQIHKQTVWVLSAFAYKNGNHLPDGNKYLSAICFHKS